MIRFIFSHLWIAIFAILFGLAEFAFWTVAIDRYKRRDDPEELVVLIIFHAAAAGVASFAYWFTLLLVA